MREWIIYHRLIWVPVGAFLFISVLFAAFIVFGGSTPSTSLLQANGSATAAPITPQCRQKLNELATQEQPLQQQLQDITNKINQFGFDFSSFSQPGKTNSIDDLAAKVGPQYEQQVKDLEDQYSTLNTKLLLLEGEGC